VIPLPVYQVSYGLHVVPSLKDEKVEKPEGPITLLTGLFTILQQKENTLLLLF
jgi:hypothetical protein